MSVQKAHTIYTIGHSTRSIEDFLALLDTFKIGLLADIRSLPGSRKYPQFNQENLKSVLEAKGISYLHIADLGGRRHVRKDSHNTRWRNESFRAYADYMETENFRKGMAQLAAVAEKQTTAYMCSEAVWWRCHRSMVSDYLKAKGWTVLHILSATNVEEHPYTSPAQVSNGEVFYCDKPLFND